MSSTKEKRKDSTMKEYCKLNVAFSTHYITNETLRNAKFCGSLGIMDTNLPTFYLCAPAFQKCIFIMIWVPKRYTRFDETLTSLSTGLEFCWDIFIKCLNLHRSPRSQMELDIPMRKTNTRLKRLSFLGPKIWSKINRNN